MNPLRSRKYPSPDDFVKDFLDTLTPGIIPRHDFIKWEAIEQKMAGLAPVLEFYAEMKARVIGGTGFVSEMADSLLACDEPLPYIKCAFQLLGHTDQELVTKQDYIELSRVAQEIKEGDEKSALYLANLLLDLGFEKVLVRDDLEDLLFGVQIGLETHRRKNIGGRDFKTEVRALLGKISLPVSKQTAKEVRISEERSLRYGRGLSKKVDFVIEVDGKNEFGVEVNFYTVSGSKPTEIKRSYGNIRQGLLSVGTDLIWITDGKGYRQMRKSLRDAYVILPNIYNLNQAKEYLAEDLIDLFCSEGG